MKSAWIDVSVPLRDGVLHWPDNPPFVSRRVQSISRGDHCNLSELKLGAHTGTHVDAPVHFLKGGPGVDRMPFAATNGPARVIEIRNARSIEPEELERRALRRGERILFKTANSLRSRLRARFARDFVYLSTAAARLAARRGVRAVGVDYLSVGGFRLNGTEVHRALLGAGVWIIEGLDLSPVKPGLYDLACLPLRIVDGDGGPARAFLRRRAR